MDAGTQTIEKLFESSKQIFQIPTFQRPYVWRLENQWEPLWEDVRELAERYGDLLTEHGDRHAAQMAAGRHFLGAVVVQRVDRPFGAPETWEIIDGQQRLTTLQLLLHAAHEVFRRLDLQQEAVHFERVVLNDSRACRGDELLKLWPTGGDRGAFAAAMGMVEDTAAHTDALVMEAHRFFETQIREWLEGTIEPSLAERADHLVVTLLALLELVVIKLDGSDDAFTIFETLNARGTPLLAADLVKNFVLQTAVSQHKDKDAFHARYWKPFEEYRESAGKPRWWLTEIRQGRLFRPRLDVFLNHWLVIRVRAEIKSRDLFTSFKDHVEKTSRDDIEPVVQHFVHVADTYRQLDAWPERSPEGRFFYRWNVVQAGVLTPVLLQLFSADAKLVPEERRRRALDHLESFLVRRLICRMTTKGYNNLFLDLVSTVDQHIERADEAIRDLLVAQDATRDRGPPTLRSSSRSPRCLSTGASTRAASA